jgi:hypothetical protein
VTRLGWVEVDGGQRLAEPEGHWQKNCTRERGRCHMLACNRLRIDPCDGSPVVDYRIENGCVESRTMETAEGGTTSEKRWQRLTPEQLSSHVTAHTVVAQWLGRRMGVHTLIRACTSSLNDGVHGYSDRIAA